MAASADAAAAAAGARAEAEPPSSGGGMLSFLYQPEADISYSFIFWSYLACSLLCAALFGLEKLQLVESIRGYWIVFAPFIVMTPWAAWMRVKATSKFGKDQDKEKKD